MSFLYVCSLRPGKNESIRDVMSSPKRARYTQNIPFSFASKELDNECVIFSDCVLDLSQCNFLISKETRPDYQEVKDIRDVPTHYHQISYADKIFYLENEDGESYGEIQCNMEFDDYGSFSIKWDLYSRKPKTADTLYKDIGEKTAEIRQLKFDNASKRCISNAVNDLVNMKERYKSITGHEYSVFSMSGIELP